MSVPLHKLAHEKGDVVLVFHIFDDLEGDVGMLLHNAQYALFSRPFPEWGTPQRLATKFLDIF